MLDLELANTRPRAPDDDTTCMAGWQIATEKLLDGDSDLACSAQLGTVCSEPALAYFGEVLWLSFFEPIAECARPELATFSP